MSKFPKSKMSKLNAAIDALADQVENGHLLASMGGEDLLLEAAREIESLRAERGALAQRLADGPCPVCLGSGVVTTDIDCTMAPCPHCGTFPEDRRGKAYESPKAAIGSLPQAIEPMKTR